MNEGWHMPRGSCKGHWFDSDGYALCCTMRRTRSSTVMGIERFDRKTDCNICWTLLKMLRKAEDDVARGALA